MNSLAYYSVSHNLAPSGITFFQREKLHPIMSSGYLSAALHHLEDNI